MNSVSQEKERKESEVLTLSSAGDEGIPPYSLF